MYFSPYKLPVLLFAFGSLYPVFVQSQNYCTQDFFSEIQKMSITQHCHMKKPLRAEFGWNFNNNTRHLDIVFGARLDSTPGWLAWGLNLHGVGMVGTQALIGTKHVNESLSCNKYNITEATKRGCQLVPSDDIGLDVRNLSFVYLEGIRYYAIRATIFLPYAYNSSRTNIVCQIGKAVFNAEPGMHPINLAHLDTGETMDLVTNEPVDYSNHQRETLRRAHGILNIAGWGTILPAGVIIARYFRMFPFEWRLWYACHILFQSIGYAAGFIGWAMGLWLGNASKHYSFGIHRILGIIIFSIATMQVLAFIFRTGESGENRKYWNMYHHSLGYILLVLIWVNIFQGIKIMEPDYVLKWFSIGVLGVLGCVVLALECATWFKYLKHRKNNKGKIDNSSSSSSQQGQYRKKAEKSEEEPKRPQTQSHNSVQ